MVTNPLIIVRKALHDFERAVPPADMTPTSTPADYLGARKPADPLYAMLDTLR